MNKVTTPTSPERTEHFDGWNKKRSAEVVGLQNMKNGECCFIILTFSLWQGIVRAIKDFQAPLKEHEVSIFVRRGGPNYQEGLRVMGDVGAFFLIYQTLVLNFVWIVVIVAHWFWKPSSAGKTTGIPIHVFGTETHMTAIVGMALGHRPIPTQPPVAAHTANFLLNSSSSTSVRWASWFVATRTSGAE